MLKFSASRAAPSSPLPVVFGTKEFLLPFFPLPLILAFCLFSFRITLTSPLTMVCHHDTSSTPQNRYSGNSSTRVTGSAAFTCGQGSADGSFAHALTAYFFWGVGLGQLAALIPEGHSHSARGLGSHGLHISQLKSQQFRP